MAPDLRQPVSKPFAELDTPRKLLWAELAASLDGALVFPDAPDFASSTHVFNAGVKSPALAVARPRHARDVSLILQWAKRESVTISVRGGGLGPAGWSVQGEIVIDMRDMDDVDMQLPDDGGRRSSSKRTAGDAFGSSGSGRSTPSRDARPATRPREGAHSGSPGEGSGSSADGGSSRETSGTSVSSDVKGKGRAVPAEPAELGMHSGSIDDLFRPLAPPRQYQGASSSRDALSAPPPPVVDQLDGSTPTQSRRPPLEQHASAYEYVTDASEFRGAAVGVDGIDREAKPALVSFGAGVTSRQLDAHTSQHGYFIPQGSYPTGTALFTTGGTGFLSRAFGLSCDNVDSLELVLADGRIVQLVPPDSDAARALSEAERAEQAELWWAHRGAGTAFGVITRITAKAYRVGRVLAGSIIFPFNAATTPSLMRHWRDCCKGAPNELYTSLILTAGPSSTSHVVVILFCWLGDHPSGQSFLRALLSWTGERCILKDVERRTFLDQQDSVVQVLSATRDCRWYIRSDALPGLSDEVIAESVARFSDIPERSAWLFELVGGAIASPNRAPSCIPDAAREAVVRVDCIHQWKLATADEGWIQSAIAFMDEVITPRSCAGPLPTFIERREPVERIVAAFGGEAEWAKLVDLKRRYDPDNTFFMSFWPSDRRLAYDYSSAANAPASEVLENGKLVIPHLGID